MVGVTRNRVILVIFLINFSLTFGGPTSSKEDYLNDYYNDYPSEYDYEDEDGDSENSKETIVTRNIKFLTQSKKITINEGDTIKLPCTVDNMDHLVIFWKKGEKIISMGNQILNTKDKRTKVVESEHGSQLVVSLAERVDSGEYSCQVSALSNSVLTHHVNVRVRPEVAPVPRSGVLKVVAGDPAELRCEVTEGSPRPEITWERKSRPFVSGETSMTGESIIFPETSRHHSGIYHCLADNGWGTLSSATIRLDVQHKPEIEQEETFIHSRDGDEVQITCTIHASPKAVVEWYKNGQLLDDSKWVIESRLNKHTLHLQKIGETEIHGKYDCRARNDYGEALATTEVSGKAAPANFKSSKMGSEETFYLLEWVVTSSSPVTEFQVEYKEEQGAARWKPLTAEVKEVATESYSGSVGLENLQPATRYLARVRAKNSYGFNSFSANFDFSTFSNMTMPQIDPKHQKSVSASSRIQLSFLLGALCLLLLVR